MNDIKTIAVLGAGDMGHGIAEVALIAGCKVFLRDTTEAFLQKGVSRIYESLEKLVAKGKVPPEHFAAIKSGLLVPCVDLEASVKEADLVIEAVPEIMDLKKEIFGIVDKAAPAHAILTTNTSTMSISEIAKATGRPDRFVGLHYFNPAIIMKLVEVIKGDKTSEETMQACWDFVVKTGKIPVRVHKDVPGFIVNRVQAPASILLNAILDSGAADAEAVDAVMRKKGMPMGPYEVFDYTGLDINYHVSGYFAKEVHPDFAMGTTLTAKYKAGELGKKTGSGIFTWKDGRAVIDLSKTSDTFDPMDLDAVKINEAAKIVEQGACSFEDVDVAVKNATGNPAGLVAPMKTVSPEDLSRRLENLSSRYGKEVFKPARLIREGAYR
jgi:enoyl-CoA hydratase/3-hydroxyacyl-CoA dehydrogenase